MDGSLAAGLGISAEVWIFLTLLACLTLFFKFSRFWSVRNLDLLLVFALTPGMMLLVRQPDAPEWTAFLWLFVGSMLWLIRCLLDIGLTRRPLLEPNLNASGLACLAIGVIGLFVAETISLPVEHGSKRNPADAKPTYDPVGPTRLPSPEAAVNEVLGHAPLPSTIKGKPRVILRRVLASLAQLGLVAGLILVGWRHFDRPIAGLAAATCYLLLPYARFALVDSGQLIPAALLVTALVLYTRPITAGLLIGLSAGWMPPCLGLIPLWAGFYRKRGIFRFLGAALAVAGTCGLLGLAVPDLAGWARSLGARTLGEAGLMPGFEAPSTGSFWSGIDPSYRLPVQIAYLALVVVVTLLPAEKNLGELISLSAALMVASQFWYLAAGGTLVLIYLPLIILMMFRPNLAAKRALPRAPKASRKARPNVMFDY